MIGVVIAGMIWGALRGSPGTRQHSPLVLGYSVAYPSRDRWRTGSPQPVVGGPCHAGRLYRRLRGDIPGGLDRPTTLQKWKFDAFDRHLLILGPGRGTLESWRPLRGEPCPRTRETILTSPTGTAVNHLMTALGPILPGEFGT